jgi:thioredoxin 1
MAWRQQRAESDANALASSGEGEIGMKKKQVFYGGQNSRHPRRKPSAIGAIAAAHKAAALGFCHNNRNFSLVLYRNQTQGAVMANELIKHTTDATFDADVLKSSTPVLVDYWAEWCGPCKMIAPILDEVATGYEGKLQIAKMNVDENREIPAKFGIRGIPTLMLFKDGELAATKVGALSKSQLTAFIDQQLA